MFFAGFAANEFFNNKTETHLRDRLDISKEVQGALSTLPTPDLKQKTLNLVADIRELLASEDQEHLKIRQRYEDKTKHLGPEYSEYDDPILQDAWSEMTTAYAESSQTTVRLYNERYRVDAVLLREEMVARLPEEVIERGDVFTGTKAYNRYYLANNSGIIEDIALDLEKLAKLFPE